MEAKLSEEARKAEAEEAEAQEGRQPASNGLNSEGDAAQHLGGPSDIDRTVTLRFPSSVTLDREKIVSMFSRFGNIDEALLRPPKKIRVEGEKHRKEYITAVVVFKSIVGAHAAVSDFASIQKQSHQEDAAGWRYIEQVNWASGKEPDAVPKPKSMTPQSTTPGQSTAAGTPSAKSRKLADDLLNRNPPETPTLRYFLNGIPYFWKLLPAKHFTSGNLYQHNLYQHNFYHPGNLLPLGQAAGKFRVQRHFTFNWLTYPRARKPLPT